MKRAIGIVMKTMPYVLYRALIYGVLCLCVIGYLTLLAVIGGVFGTGAFWALFLVSVGLVAMLGLAGFVGEYVFYQLKAGHVALITEIITEGQLPVGISQMKWARGRVLHYFDAADPRLGPGEILGSVRKVLRAVNRKLFESATALPLPGIECGTRFTEHMVDLSQEYVEEAVIAYAFKAKDRNLPKSAVNAIAVYCQSWKVILGNAVTLTVLSYCFALLAAVMFLVPLGFVAAQVVAPERTIVKFVLFATGVFLGFAAKWALFDPVACASTVLTFLEESDVSPPDPEWEKQVESVSEAFADLKQKADEGAGEAKVKRAAKRPRGRRPDRD